MLKKDLPTSTDNINEPNKLSSTLSSSALTIKKLNNEYNKFQKLALDKLSPYGVTTETFKECPWFNSMHHYLAFGYLISRKKWSIDKALAEIFNLDHNQLNALTKGLEKIDIEALTVFQLQALCELHSEGLTANNLKGKNWFNSIHHFNALKHLILHDFFTIDNAINTLENLTEAQLIGIYIYELSKEEVIGLTFIHIHTLSKLKNIGLTADQLRGKDWFNSEEHQNCLFHLIWVKGLNIKNALIEIDQLNSAQAKAICSELTRQDVMELNASQASALFELHTLGLTSYHFKNKPWFNSQIHVELLKKLINEDPLEIDNAFALLNHTSEEQALAIFKGFKKDDILLLNKYQLIALNEFHHQGLTINHFKVNHWFNSETHYLALKYLLTLNIKIDAIFTALNDLSEEQIKLFSEDHLKELSTKILNKQMKHGNEVQSYCQLI